MRKILYRGIASDLFDEVLGTYRVADEFSLRAAIGGGKIREDPLTSRRHV